jgi:hypothetical protein
MAEVYDVIVAGGGAGGVGAALGAAKAGARVCLLERYGFLGGAATNAQVLAYCGFFHQGDAPIQAVAGAGEQVLDTLRELGVDCQPYHSPTTSNWIVLLEPERVKIALDRICAEHGVEVRLHARVTEAERDDDALRGLVAEGPGGPEELRGRAFVDASGDAHLARAAGLPCRTGDGEGRIQAYTMPLRISGLAPETKIRRDDIKRAVALYNRGSNDPIHRTDGGIYTRVPGSGDFWWLIVDRDIPALDSASYTRAEQRAREMALALTGVLKETVEGFEGAWLAQTGPQIGVRETRHPAAGAEVTRDDVITGRLRADGIARAAWPIELHGEAGRPLYERVGGAGYYHVPYGAICAQGLGNLWYAGRVIGADPMAYGSIRVMGTAFATGEAAGVAAALSADAGTAPDAAQVRSLLESHGALL